MSIHSPRIKEAGERLSDILDAELADIIDLLGPDHPIYKIKIPEANSIDFNVEELASIVARTSNLLGDIARIAGKVRAKQKQAEGKYKRKFKSSQRGKNVAEREATAIEASADEYAELNLVEQVVELVESAEMYGRIASESARKLLSSAGTINIATRREAAGYYVDGDFN